MTLVSASLLAQVESYVILRYGIDFNSVSKYYKLSTSNFNSGFGPISTNVNDDGTNQTDYTGVNFDKDRFNRTNWVFKMGVLTDGVYFESDTSFLAQSFLASMYEYVSDNDLKSTLHYGVGNLKKIDEYTYLDSARGLGNFSNIYDFEIAFGTGFLVGPYVGFSGLGIGRLENVYNTFSTQNDAYTLFPDGTGTIIGSLGFHVNVDNGALISLRVNRIRNRYRKGFMAPVNINGEETHVTPWRGIELYPSVKVFAGDGAGLYIEAFARYAKFFEYSNPRVVMPGYSYTHFGIKAGFYIPYY